MKKLIARVFVYAKWILKALEIKQESLRKQRNESEKKWRKSFFIFLVNECGMELDAISYNCYNFFLSFIHGAKSTLLLYPRIFYSGVVCMWLFNENGGKFGYN